MKLASVSSGPRKSRRKVPAKTPTLLDVRAETCPGIYVSPRTQLRKKSSNGSHGSSPAHDACQNAATFESPFERLLL